MEHEQLVICSPRRIHSVADNLRHITGGYEFNQPVGNRLFSAADWVESRVLRAKRWGN